MATLIPNENDVLLGRGSLTNNHPGNRRLRSLVDAQRPRFALSKRKKEKRAIAHGIIDEVHGLSPPGRFLIEDRKGLGGRGKGSGRDKDKGEPRSSNVHPSVLDMTWIRANPEKAYDKVLHRLREKAKGGDGLGAGLVPGRCSLQRADGPNSDADAAMGLDAHQNAALGSGQSQGELHGSRAEVIGQAITEGVILKQNAVDDGGQCEPLLLGTGPPNDAKEGAEREDTAEVGPVDARAIEHGNVDTLLDEHTAFNVALGQLQSKGKAVEGALLNDVSGQHSALPMSETLFEEGLDSNDLDSIHREHHASQQVIEQTLRIWIKETKSKLNFDSSKSGLSREAVLKYVMLSLPIAIKLTECLIEAEQEEIPLASIVIDNILLRARAVHSGEKVKETIQYVWIMSCIGDRPDAGGIMQRLYAMGIVLYELFSGEECEPQVSDAHSNSPSVSSDLNSRLKASQRPQKKPLARSEDDSSSRLLRLESIGIPHSLCAVVGNLLECSNGDLRGDEAYTSFVDLQMDLQLMSDNPSRFLKDIKTNPLPTLQICEKFYGREEETAKLEASYRRHFDGGCRGVIISGGAGVGKSRLAMRMVQRLTSQSNGYLLFSKFNQGQDLTPFSTIGNVFNSLCDSFARDANSAETDRVEKALTSALGDQGHILAGIVPSLFKLMPGMPSYAGGTCNECVDSALSLQFLFSELLRLISSHSRTISILLDDLQWSDSASLLLVESLIHTVENNGNSVFFTLCHRDNDHSENSHFNAWLSSISMFRLETIKLENMTPVVVNSLVSDSLHLTRRITRPLASTLHHKSGGNPLFLRQLMESLIDQGFIYFSLNPPRWAWDLDRITDLKISDDVVALLIREMQRLPSELQLGLKISSCLGSRVKFSIVDIISKDLGVDLISILQQVSSRGFMNNTNSTMFTFSHDKIEQAGYNLMTEQERDGTHMQLGLTLCTHALSNVAGNDELFFTAVNQVNLGGPDTVHDECQRRILAELNLNAGRRAIDLANYGSAYTMFEHGISFLRCGHWTTDYRLSIDLFDAAAEAASVLDKRKEVTFFSDQLVQHATCFNDKVNCLFAAVKAMRGAYLLKDSMENSIAILQQLGEDMPVEMGDEKLNCQIQIMNDSLQNMSDDSILNMKENTDTNIVTLLKIYGNLADLLHFAKPSLMGAVSHRMVEITLKNGLTPTSPLAFCHYAEVLTACGKLTEGCRLGRLGLKLCEKMQSSRYRSCVLMFCYQALLWASEPLHSIVDAHTLGRKAGQQAGDFVYASLNWLASIVVDFIAGQSLDTVDENILELINEMQNQNSHAFIPKSVMLHSSSIALREGLHVLDEDRADGIPTEKELLAGSCDKVFLLGQKVHQLVRKFLFNQLDAGSQDIIILDEINEQQHVLRPLLLWGIFFEGLASYQFARQTDEAARWIRNAESAHAKVKYWSEHSSWNFMNKVLLLEAERLYTLGDLDHAATFYMDSIRFARKHKFVHEEGIASELAGVFFCKRGIHKESVNFLLHSIQSYRKWGATALARKVENFIASNYSLDFEQLCQNFDLLEHVFAEEEDSKKR